MSQVLDAMFEKFCTEGEHIIDQDDDGDNFYVIERWTCTKLQLTVKQFTLNEHKLCLTEWRSKRKSGICHWLCLFLISFFIQWDIQYFREGWRRREAGRLLWQQRQLWRTSVDVQHPAGSHHHRHLKRSPLVPSEYTIKSSCESTAGFL